MKASALNRFLAELTSFSRAAAPVPPADLDWEELVEVAERHGLAAILSYQLDYRFLARVNPPAAVRDRLGMTFNALVNDNVLKLTQLRRLLSPEVVGQVPEAVLLGPAAVADVLYPHIAFRPVNEVDLWVQPASLHQAREVLADNGLASTPVGPTGVRRPMARLGNPDIQLRLWAAPPGLALSPATAAELWSRRVPVRAYGPLAFRLAPADALCAVLGNLAQDGFAVPRIALLDLREMILRCDGRQPFYGTRAGLVLGPAELQARARSLGLGRTLWAGATLIGELFPEARAQADALLPAVPSRVGALLREVVVRPALDPQRTQVWRAAQALRRALLA